MSRTNNSDKKQERSDNVLSEATPVRIGLIVALLGGFGGGIWWAASITTKLDSILAFQNSTTSSISELKAADVNFSTKLEDLKMRVALDEAQAAAQSAASKNTK